MTMDRFWEVEACVPPNQESVQGRLKRSLTFWKDVLQAPPPIVDCIENGYRLPLKFLPPPYSQGNHESAELHRQFVDEATWCKTVVSLKWTKDRSYVVPCLWYQILLASYTLF